MLDFRNILYVSKALPGEDHALRQTLELLQANPQAQVKVLISCPPFPEKLTAYREAHEKMLRDIVQGGVAQACAALGMVMADVEGRMTFEVDAEAPAFLGVIKRVLRDKYDIVIKPAEAVEGGTGFQSMDMSLLRKCPCPVWLCRPPDDIAGISYAVAIDPTSEEPAGHHLAVTLLRLADLLAGKPGFSVVSCWNYPFEDTLRYSALASLPPGELKKILEEERRESLAALEKLIAEAGVKGKYDIKHIKALPEKGIPDFVRTQKIDVLIMGTVARTGIPGFIMGNTAENVLRNVTSSLLALKPAGYVSPVKPY